MGPYKCPECGVWWAGFEHRCRPSETTTGATIDRLLIRNDEPVVVKTQSTTSAPYCAVCQGWHIPGHGPCTATFSVV